MTWDGENHGGIETETKLKLKMMLKLKLKLKRSHTASLRHRTSFTLTPCVKILRAPPANNRFGIFPTHLFGRASLSQSSAG